MRNRVILKEVAAAARQAGAKQIRSALFEDCRALVSELEGAIVAWSPQGKLRTAFYAGKGPIRPAIIPVLAQDALSRHVAQHMVAPVTATMED
jgi:hypothetical protein